VTDEERFNFTDYSIIRCYNYIDQKSYSGGIIRYKGKSELSIFRFRIYLSRVREKVYIYDKLL